MKNIFKNCYRIVKDNYLGYEVQIKRWFFPFIWFQKEKKERINTFSNVEDAIKWIEDGCPKDKKEKRIIYWKKCDL